MTRKPVRDQVASVRQRLLNIARERREDFQLVLTRYCIERFLYRLGVSEHAGKFILKGAMLYLLWGEESYRPTRDLDLLGRGESSPRELEEALRAVCRTEAGNDGVQFDSSGVRARPIRGAQEYGGLHVEVATTLGQARLTLQIDIGFGDAVTPRPRKMEFPSLLDFPRPRLLACPKEMVVAEKFQAMVVLGIANSRMKDFYDLSTFASSLEFRGEILARALKATFRRRSTPLPAEPPLALTAEFSQDEAKQAQWGAFLNKTHLDARGMGLPQACALIGRLLLPPANAALSNQAFRKTWQHGGPWR